MSTNATLALVAESTYYVLRDVYTQDPQGPYSSAQLKGLAESGLLNSEMLISQDGGEWASASACRGLFAPAAPTADSDADPVDGSEPEQEWPSVVRKPRPDTRQRARNDRQARMRRASGWLIAIAVLVALSGTYIGIKAQGEVDDAFEALSRSGMPPEALIDIEGQWLTVAEAKDMADQEVMLVFVVNYGLAALYFGLFFWSRSAPLPAMIIALAAYLVVQVINVVMDPGSLHEGIVVKALFIAALIAGIKAAIAEQASRQRELTA